jgi:hypothetical protein
MFAIKVGDTFLDLEQSPVRFEIINSIFEQGALQGDWSFPFPIKWSDKNGVAFGFANMLEVPNKKISYPATFYFGTKSFINGILILSAGGNDYFNSNIAGGVKGLTVAKKNLKELNYINPATGNGTIVLNDVSTNSVVKAGLRTAALQFQTADYTNIIAFPPHSNPNFYGNNNPDFQGIVNVVIAEDGTHPYNIPGTGGNKYCLVPFVYLFHILETGFGEDGLRLAGTFSNDLEMKKILIYNNYALDKQSDLGCIVKSGVNELIVVEDTPGLNFKRPTLLNNLPGCLDEFSRYNNILFEFVIASNLQHDIRFDGDFFGSTAGDFTISLVVDPIAGGGYAVVDSLPVVIGTGASYTANLYAIVPGLQEGDKVFVLATQNVGQPNTSVTLLAGATLTVRAYTAQVFNGMENVVTIKNHVPDMTFEDFLNELKKDFQLDFTYDFINNKVVINYVNTIMDSIPELDLTSNFSKNYELLFDLRNKGYVVGYDFGTSDNLIENNFKKYDSTRLLGYYNSIDVLPTPTSAGDFAIVKSTNKVMVSVGNDFVYSWTEYTDNYFDITTGEGTTEVKSRLAPMMMIETENETNIAPDPANTRALIPAISETGSSPVFDLGDNTASLRMVYMRGMNVSGGQYVCASATNFDQLGVQNGSYTLKMNDSDGIYKKLHEKIITALTTSDIVEREMLADINLLSDPRLKRKISAGNMHWLLYSLSAQIGATISISKSKWLKL